MYQNIRFSHTDRGHLYLRYTCNSLKHPCWDSIQKWMRCSLWDSSSSLTAGKQLREHRGWEHKTIWYLVGTTGEIFKIAIMGTKLFLRFFTSPSLLHSKSAWDQVQPLSCSTWVTLCQLITTLCLSFPIGTMGTMLVFAS